MLGFPYKISSVMSRLGLLTSLFAATECLPPQQAPDVDMAKEILRDGHFESWVSSWIDRVSPTPSADPLDKTVTAPELPEVVRKWDIHGISLSGENSEGDEGAERPSAPTPMFRRRQQPNWLCIDSLGVHIPPDVQAVVDMHFKKSRSSLTFGPENINKPVRHMELGHIAEPALSGMLIASFSPGREVACGGGNSWTRQAMPRNPNDSGPVAPPKASRLFGFPTSVGSSWSLDELEIADHPAMRPYSQPTSEALFPSYLREIKSEARGGSIHAAEGDLASAGAHRVNSWLWVLDQLEPTRKRSGALLQPQGRSLLHVLHRPVPLPQGHAGLSGPRKQRDGLAVGRAATDDQGRPAKAAAGRKVLEH